MTGDLLVNAGSDAVRLMRCTDLVEGKIFYYGWETLKISCITLSESLQHL